MGAAPRRVVVAANSAWNIVNFRIGLIRALEPAGYEAGGGGAARRRGGTSDGGAAG